MHQYIIQYSSIFPHVKASVSCLHPHLIPILLVLITYDMIFHPITKTSRFHQMPWALKLQNFPYGGVQKIGGTPSHHPIFYENFPL